MPVYQNSGPGIGQAILGGVNDFVDARQKRVQDELLKQQIQDMARNRVRQSAVDAQNGLHFTEPGQPLPATVAQNIGDYAGRAGAASIPDNAVNSDISFSPNGGTPTLSRAGAGRSLIPGAPQSAPQRQSGTTAAPSFQNILSSMMGGQAPDRGAQYEFGKGYYVDHGPAWEAADVARAQKAQDQFTPMLVQRMVAQQDKADKIARYTAAGVPADRAALYVDNPALADNDPRIGKPHTDVMAERTAKSVMLNGRPAEVMIDKAGNAFDAMGNKVTGALTPYVAPPNPETAALRELALGQRKDSMSQRNEARLVQQYTEATKKYSQTADALQAINENREGALKGDPIAQQTLLQDFIKLNLPGQQVTEGELGHYMHLMGLGEKGEQLLNKLRQGTPLGTEQIKLILSHADNLAVARREAHANLRKQYTDRGARSGVPEEAFPDWFSFLPASSPSKTAASPNDPGGNIDLRGGDTALNPFASLIPKKP